MPEKYFIYSDPLDLVTYFCHDDLLSPSSDSVSPLAVRIYDLPMLHVLPPYPDSQLHSTSESSDAQPPSLQVSVSQVVLSW